MSDRAKWLESLTEGQAVQVVSRIGRYPAKVGEIREADIALTAVGMPKNVLWVWRSCGTRPAWECYIAPADAPLDYPSPLTQTECSAA